MVISTKLPIVKDLIEITTLIQMYQNDMKMVLDYLAPSLGEEFVRVDIFGSPLKHITHTPFIADPCCLRRGW